MELQDAIKVWKENNIEECIMEFSCGGDSMNDTSFSFSDNKGSEISCPELESFFDEAVYNNVEFYVNSDGHYQGEAGNVVITLEGESEEDEEFMYSKNAEAEFSEMWNSTMELELPTKMVDFINKNVSNINGSQDDVVINFKRDFILSEKDEMLLSLIEDKIAEETRDYSPKECDVDEEWYTFTTNGKGEELKMEGNKLIIQMSNQYTRFEPSND